MIAAAAHHAAAQQPARNAPPRNFASASITGFLDFDRVPDESGTWSFGAAIGAGAGYHRLVGSGLFLGVDVTYSRPSYDVVEVADTLSGTANIITTLLSARLRYGGLATLGSYITGGAGAFTYGLGELEDEWDTDFALYAGAGLEYFFSPKRGLFLEWGRYWTFHGQEGVSEDATPKHSQLRVGGRFAF